MNFKAAREAWRVGNGTRVASQLAALFPDDPDVNRIPEFVRFALAGGPVPGTSDGATRAFLDSIARVAPAQRDASRRTRHHLPAEFDFIADLEGVQGWTAAQALNRLVLDTLPPRKRSAVVGTMRDDGIYILEFVAHYLALGFDHIFIYTNDNADLSDELFALLAQHRVITLVENVVTGEVPPEAKAFGHALNLLGELRDYEWALFVDSDEFLVLAPEYQHSIGKVLDAVDRAPDAIGGICYDWLWFVSDMIFERTPGLLCERFQHARPHWLSKCFVRLCDTLSMRHQHYPELVEGREMVDSLLHPLDVVTIWERRVPEYQGGRINHYWPRSFQEFAIKKARGASLGGENNLYDRPYDQFFSWNGYSTAENFCPTDPALLERIKDRMAALRTLEGVAAAADRIEAGFPQFLARLGSDLQLRRLYRRNLTEPGDL